MQKKLHKSLIYRLIAGWIVLSAGIGIIVFFIETEKIDHEVVNLAYDESRYFLGHHQEYFDSDNPELPQILQPQLSELIQNHFIVVELYDRNKEKIIEKVRPENEYIEEILKKYKHDFPLTNEATYEKFYIDQRMYLQVLVPMKNNESDVIGYFEGVYEVDEATMLDIRNRIFWSLAQTILVILATTILLYPIILSLNKNLILHSRRLLQANIDLLEVLGSAISKRDNDTNIHNYRVTIYAVRLAEAIHLSSEQIQDLIKGAFLHDVGKIGIPDQILLKPGKLDEREYELMKSHVQHGVDIVKNSDWLKDASQVVQYHHEKYDGTGYMKGLQGEQIPILARIFAIADVFDALTSRRPYKEPMSYEKAIGILQEGSGTHFDLDLFQQFKKISKDLYNQIFHADEEKIKGILKDYIKKYFYDN